MISDIVFISEKAVELKDSTVAAAHVAQEKASEIVASTKDALVSGEKVVEEKLVAAKDTVLGKCNDPFESI